MTPSNTWFPQSLQERAAWFQNFKDKFALLAAGLGFLPADVTAVTNDNLAFQFLASSAVDIDTFGKGMTAFRKEICEGVNGSPQADLPTPPDFGPTPPTTGTGIFERLDDLVKRIRVAPTYSTEEGQQLGIVPSPSGGPPNLVDDAKPVLRARAMPGNVVEVGFVRGKTDGVAIEIRIDNDPNWTDQGRFFKSPAELQIPSVNGNLPRAVQARARFVDGNSAVGQLSDTINVVTTP